MTRRHSAICCRQASRPDPKAGPKRNRGRCRATNGSDGQRRSSQNCSSKVQRPRLQVTPAIVGVSSRLSRPSLHRICYNEVRRISRRVLKDSANRSSRGVAQPGRAPGSGPGGRRFKSSLPDHLFSATYTDSEVLKNPAVGKNATLFSSRILLLSFLPQKHLNKLR